MGPPRRREKTAAPGVGSGAGAGQPALGWVPCHQNQRRWVKLPSNERGCCSCAGCRALPRGHSRFWSPCRWPRHSSVLGAGLQPAAPSLEDVCCWVSASPSARHPSRLGRADVASLRRAGEGWQETAAPPAPHPRGTAGAGSELTYRPSRKKGRGVAVKCAQGSSCRAGGAMPISLCRCRRNCSSRGLQGSASLSPAVPWLLCCCQFLPTGTCSRGAVPVPAPLPVQVLRPSPVPAPCLRM